MAEKATLPADIAVNPAWLIHDFQPMLRRFAAAKVPESLYRDSAFINNAIVPQLGNVMQVELPAMYAAFQDVPPVAQPARYIFHFGHCGSTLVSRALGTAMEVLPVREPQLLIAISQCLRDVADPLSWLSASEYEALERIGLLAMERRFRPDQVPVIKMTSTCNNLLKPVLDQHPDRKALFLYQPLEPALAGILRSQQKPNSDLRSQAQVRLKEWSELTGQMPPRLAELRPEQIAVISWISNAVRMQRALADYHDHVLVLDFQDFLDDPVAHLARICQHFDLPETVQQSVVAGYSSVARNYSKDPSRNFSATDRQAILNKARLAFRSQIRAGLNYANTLLSAHGLTDALAPFIK